MILIISTKLKISFYCFGHFRPSSGKAHTLRQSALKYLLSRWISALANG